MTKMSSQQSPAALQSTVDREKVYGWIIELSNSETRENALLELSKKREVVPDLAPMLWHSFGTIASLLQEIINIYPAINPATLTAYQSNRVCNALALLQCVASHPETRSSFLQVSARRPTSPGDSTGDTDFEPVSPRPDRLTCRSSCIRSCTPSARPDRSSTFD